MRCVQLHLWVTVGEGERHFGGDEREMSVTRFGIVVRAQECVSTYDSVVLLFTESDRKMILDDQSVFGIMTASSRKSRVIYTYHIPPPKHIYW